MISRRKFGNIDTNIVSLSNTIITISKSRPTVTTEELAQGVIDALKRAYTKELNEENVLKVIPLKKIGDFALFETKTVVSKVENINLEIDLVEAQKIEKKATIGMELDIPVFLSRYSRFAIQTVSQSIKHAINVAESQKIYDQFIERKGTIMTGTVETVDYRYFSVDIGGNFAFVPRDEQIPREHIEYGKRIKIYILNIFHQHPYGQIMGSRIANEFLFELLKLEIPEVNNNVIRIHQLVREPGIRAKLSISSTDNTIDPVGTCIGRAGSRIKNISRELNGEKIDIFLHDDDIKQFIINASTPAKVVSINVDEDEKKAKIIVLRDQYPIAIGRFGSGVRLLSSITGYEIEISLLEDVYQEYKQIELNGNISLEDLKKLEIDSEIIAKFVPLTKQTTSEQ